MKLQDAFKSQESHVIQAVLFVELTDSTKMKETKPEVEWLPTLGWFYDLITNKIVTEHNGTMTKFLKDGAMAVFDMDHVAEAINAAISLQEALIEAINDKYVDCFASIGIATGRVVKFKHFQDQADYVGTVVDLANLLCNAASPKAILVDTQTVVHANMGKVFSKFGRLCDPPRSARDYIGDENSLEARGFNKKVRYHQILWGNHPYGLKPEFVGRIEPEIPPIDSIPSRSPIQQRNVPTIEEVLQEVSNLWGINKRQDAIALCVNLSKSGSAEADDLIFQMAKALIDEALQENNKAKFIAAIDLLKYAASEGHQEARDMIDQLGQYSK